MPSSLPLTDWCLCPSFLLSITVSAGGCAGGREKKSQILFFLSNTFWRWNVIIEHGDLIQLTSFIGYLGSLERHLHDLLPHVSFQMQFPWPGNGCFILLSFSLWFSVFHYQIHFLTLLGSHWPSGWHSLAKSGQVHRAVSHVRPTFGPLIILWQDNLEETGSSQRRSTASCLSRLTCQRITGPQISQAHSDICLPGTPTASDKY